MLLRKTFCIVSAASLRSFIYTGDSFSLFIFIAFKMKHTILNKELQPPRNLKKKCFHNLYTNFLYIVTPKFHSCILYITLFCYLTYQQVVFLTKLRMCTYIYINKLIQRTIRLTDQLF